MLQGSNIRPRTHGKRSLSKVKKKTNKNTFYMRFINAKAVSNKDELESLTS